jgi:hypothetical protein
MNTVHTHKEDMFLSLLLRFVFVCGTTTLGYCGPPFLGYWGVPHMSSFFVVKPSTIHAVQRESHVSMDIRAIVSHDTFSSTNQSIVLYLHNLHVHRRPFLIPSLSTSRTVYNVFKHGMYVRINLCDMKTVRVSWDVRTPEKTYATGSFIVHKIDPHPCDHDHLLNDS